MKNKNRVCPVERAGGLDNIFRKWLHNPRKILGEFIKEGMTILDIGCGPGLFSIEMAIMSGKSGKVIAADLQEGMLKRLEKKISGTVIQSTIVLHKCEKNKLGISVDVDFVLAFYMVHEVPDKDEFFKEIFFLIKPNGIFLIIEPNFHVSKRAFAKAISQAEAAGFKRSTGPKVFLSRTAVLKK